MSESGSAHFESQNPLPAPSAGPTTSQLLDYYFKTRGKTSIGLPISLLPIRLEYSLNQNHLESELSARSSNQELREFIKRLKEKVSDLEDKIIEKNKKIKLLEKKVKAYANSSIHNKCLNGMIGYNLNNKDQEIARLKKELKKYVTNFE